MTTPKFDDLGLRAELSSTLSDLGYETPTPIQSAAIPTLLAGRDMLAQAATGTGKTAAFALPILERLTPRASNNPRALVLAPTRELAVQVADAMETYGKKMGARVLAIYGGQPFDKQLRPLKSGVDIVVATPGRALDHLKRKTLRLDEIETVVLDEADEMLDMGFADELEAILETAPKTRQTALFSATMPSHLRTITNKHLNDPEHITIKREKTPEGEKPRVRQSAYIVDRHHKPAALARVLAVESPKAAIIFCRTRQQVEIVTAALNERGHSAESLHGGLNQEQRDRVMARVRNFTVSLLVATDVAARGLDIDHMTHVVNFDIPASSESYVHRIGRVGRAGREGVAITLVEPRAKRSLETLERETKNRIAVERIPSVEAMRARRVEQLGEALRSQLETESDRGLYKSIVADLAETHDLEVVAAAALEMAASNLVAIDEEHIPEPFEGRKKERFEKSGKFDKPSRFDNKKGRRPSGPMAKIFVGAGRSAQIRPQDLVGLIANETPLSGKEIGSIDIMDNFSLVEVPAASVNEVIARMRATTVRGKKVTVRRDRPRQ